MCGFLLITKWKSLYQFLCAVAVALCLAASVPCLLLEKHGSQALIEHQIMRGVGGEPRFDIGRPVESGSHCQCSWPLS